MMVVVQVVVISGHGTQLGPINNRNKDVIKNQSEHQDFAIYLTSARLLPLFFLSIPRLRKMLAENCEAQNKFMSRFNL